MLFVLQVLLLAVVGHASRSDVGSSGRGQLKQDTALPEDGKLGLVHETLRQIFHISTSEMRFELDGWKCEGYTDTDRNDCELESEQEECVPAKGRGGEDMCEAFQLGGVRHGDSYFFRLPNTGFWPTDGSEQALGGYVLERKTFKLALRPQTWTVYKRGEAAAPLFTIQRSGRSTPTQPLWKIYDGRKRDQTLMYYGQPEDDGLFFFFRGSSYKGQADKEWCAVFKRTVTGDLQAGVKPGEDAALLLLTGFLVDRKGEIVRPLDYDTSDDELED